MTGKIEYIKIVGFQSHGETKLKFHPHLNIIVGPSDEGKSAILRAIKKVVRDLPSGNGFVSNKTDTCKIVLGMNNGAKITRKVVCDVKGTTKVNEYQVKIENDVQKFVSFGREIPLEVRNTIGWPLIDLDDGSTIDIHFSGQHDQPFLVASTPAIKSKVLGRVSGLHIIDVGIKKSNKDARRIGDEIKGAKNNIDELQKELQKFPNINELQKQAKFFENSLNTIGQKIEKLKQLKVLRDQLTDVVQQGKQIQKDLKSLPILPENTLINLENKIGHCNQLNKLTLEYTQICRNITELESNPLLTFTITIDNFEEIQQKCEKLKKYKSCLEEILKVKNQGKVIKNEVGQLEKDLVTAQQTWKMYLKELGVCPTCNQQIREV